jgi:hypothetical protein
MIGNTGPGTSVTLLVARPGRPRARFTSISTARAWCLPASKSAARTAGWGLRQARCTGTSPCTRPQSSRVSTDTPRHGNRRSRVATDTPRRRNRALPSIHRYSPTPKSRRWSIRRYPDTPRSSAPEYTSLLRSPEIRAPEYTPILPAPAPDDIRCPLILPEHHPASGSAPRTRANLPRRPAIPSRPDTRMAPRRPLLARNLPEGHARRSRHRCGW